MEDYSEKFIKACKELQIVNTGRDLELDRTRKELDEAKLIIGELQKANAGRDLELDRTRKELDEAKLIIGELQKANAGRDLELDRTRKELDEAKLIIGELQKAKDEIVTSYNVTVLEQLTSIHRALGNVTAAVLPSSLKDFVALAELAELMPKCSGCTKVLSGSSEDGLVPVVYPCGHTTCLQCCGLIDAIHSAPQCPECKTEIRDPAHVVRNTSLIRLIYSIENVLSGVGIHEVLPKNSETHSLVCSEIVSSARARKSTTNVITIDSSTSGSGEVVEEERNDKPLEGRLSHPDGYRKSYCDAQTPCKPCRNFTAYKNHTREKAAGPCNLRPNPGQRMTKGDLQWNHKRLAANEHSSSKKPKGSSPAPSFEENTPFPEFDMEKILNFPPDTQELPLEMLFPL